MLLEMIKVFINSFSYIPFRPNLNFWKGDEKRDWHENFSYMDFSFFRKYLCPTLVSDIYSDIGMTLRSFKYMKKFIKIE